MDRMKPFFVLPVSGGSIFIRQPESWTLSVACEFVSQSCLILIGKDRRSHDDPFALSESSVSKIAVSDCVT